MDQGAVNGLETSLEMKDLGFRSTSFLDLPHDLGELPTMLHATFLNREKELSVYV